MRISEDVQILRIDRIRWLAAVRATYYERKQKSTGETPILNSAGEKVDLLTRELENIDHVDTSNTNVTGGEPTRERRSSLASTSVSDGGVEHEKLLAQHPILSNLSNSTKLPTDSPVNSGRTTPILTQKNRKHLFRSATTTTTTTPPSLTNESPVSIYSSLT